MNTTLIIMAAGIGSRFGTGIKQLAAMNAAGEIIMDYSVYDAVEAGFNHVVFIIRHEIEAEFKEVIGNRIEEALKKRNVTVDYTYQELTDLPESYTVPAGRTKPWGTGQAVLTCRGVVDTPFVIINADDYYGKEAFVKLHDFLVKNKNAADSCTMAMAGFVLKNTVSSHGTVTRGVCRCDAQNMLTQVIETTGIAVRDGSVQCENAQVQSWVTPDTPVSMNMWAAYPKFLDCLADGFREFLADEAGDPLKREFLVPVMVDSLLKKGRATVKLLDTGDKWIGITYKEDLEAARAEFRAMIDAGTYRERLWE